MKLLLTVSYYTPYISGLTLSVGRLAQEFAKRNIKVTILTTQHDKNLPTSEINNKIHIMRVPWLIRLSKGFFMPLYLLYTIRAVRKTDLVMINLPQAEGVIVALVAYLMKKKILCNYYCDVQLPESVINTCIMKLLDLANSLCMHMARRVVTCTKDYAKYSRVLTRFTQKLEYIYPPIISPKVMRTMESKLEKMVGKKSVIIGMLGRIASEKGIEYVLEAIPELEKRFGSVTIVFAGPHPSGEERYKEKITLYRERYKKNIVFLGKLSSDTIGAFFSVLDVLILPSINSTEALGIVQVEAMLCGTPVIATNLPGVRVPVHKTGMGIIIPPQNTAAIIRAVEEIMNDKKKYIKKREVIRREFSLKKTVETYLRLLQQ